MTWLCGRGHDHESAQEAITCQVQHNYGLLPMYARRLLLNLPTYKPDQEAFEEAFGKDHWRN